jgi:hypothetical protein
MRKLALGLAILLGTVSMAEAQQHQRRQGYQPRQHQYQPRQHHYQPPVRHNHQRKVSPWVYGLGAMALGAGTYYYMNQPVCERYIVGYRWNGYRNVPVIEEYCQ